MDAGKMSSMTIEVWKDSFEMDELLESLPQKGKIYNLKEGMKIRHTLLVKKRNISRGNTWIGIIVNGVIYHAGKTYTKPSLFVRAHFRSNGGKSVSGFDAEVLYEDVWIPYSIFIR